MRRQQHFSECLYYDWYVRAIILIFIKCLLNVYEGIPMESPIVLDYKILRMFVPTF